LTELAFEKDSLETRLATRRVLVQDQLFFKRRKTTFEPRTEEVVAELRVQLDTEARKEVEQTLLVEALLDRLKNPGTALPDTVSSIEQLAVFGSQAPHWKEALALVEKVIESASLSIGGGREDKAFKLLVAVGRFSADENLALRRYRREVQFSPDVTAEAEQLASSTSHTLALDTPRTDLTSLFTITVDNSDTRDIDDALSLEQTNDGFRIGVHIADVASVIPAESSVGEEALARGTSIYCPDCHVPMVAKVLSENALSLTEGEKRPVISFLIEFDKDFQIRKREIISSIIQVTARMSYDEVDAILCQEHEQAAAGYEKRVMLHRLWEVTTKLEMKRLENGAIQYSRRQQVPILQEDGTIILETSYEDSPSHKMVGELMILANETGATWAKKNNIPLIFRTQEPPEVTLEDQGLDIPNGIAREYFRRTFMKRSANSAEPLVHSGLALPLYTQVTSPIRRIIDLINQRQLAQFLNTGHPLYDVEKIKELIQRLEITLGDALAVQRESNRYWLLKYLQQEKVQQIEGTVIKVDTPRPLAELGIIYTLHSFHPYGYKQDRQTKTKKKVGDRVKLKVENIDPRRDVLVLGEIS